MIRFILSLPGGITAERCAEIRDQLQAAENDHRWRDIVLANGGTITDMRGKPVTALVRRARAKAR